MGLRPVSDSLGIHRRPVRPAACFDGFDAAVLCGHGRDGNRAKARFEQRNQRVARFSGDSLHHRRWRSSQLGERDSGDCILDSGEGEGFRERPANRRTWTRRDSDADFYFVDDDSLGLWGILLFFCGAISFVVLFLWWYYCTDWPEQHASVNAAELALIHPQGRKIVGPRSAAVAKRTPVPWGRLFSSGSIWGLILGYGCQGYAFYVYYNWFYFYAVKVRGLGIMPAAAWTSFPFLAMTLISPLGGLFSDRISRNFGRRRGRQSAVWLGMGLSAALL